MILWGDLDTNSELNLEHMYLQKALLYSQIEFALFVVLRREKEKGERACVHQY